jgi:hypothetical protein
VNLRLSPQDAGEEDMADVAQRRLVRELEKHKVGDEVETACLVQRAMEDGQSDADRA